MSFKAMIVGLAVMLAAGSVVAFAGEDHPRTIKVDDAKDNVTHAKVKADKRDKLSEADFKKVAVSATEKDGNEDKAKTFDESAFRSDDDEVDGAFDDDDDGDDSDGKDDTSDGLSDSASGSNDGTDDGDHSGPGHDGDDDGFDDGDHSGHDGGDHDGDDDSN